MQTMPSSIQLHEFALSATQVWASPWPAHGSTGGVGVGQSQGRQAVPAGQVGQTQPVPGSVVAGGVLPPTMVVVVPVELLPPAPTLPAPQAQSQGGQVVPGAQVGQAQVHVPPPLPPPAQVPPPPAVHSQVHGGQVSPGAHDGQAQVHVPPPVPPDGGFEQSHWTAGQSALAGQASGCTQVQPPPEASRV
jgi:hypothetical protein